MTQYLETGLKEYFDPITRVQQIMYYLAYIQLTIGNLKVQIDSADIFAEFQSTSNAFFCRECNKAATITEV